MVAFTGSSDPSAQWVRMGNRTDFSANRARSRWKEKESWQNRLFQLIMMVQVVTDTCQAVQNEFMPISVLCQRSDQSFMSDIPRPIDGAVVVSHDERDIDCDFTFQTESILERFMIRFEDLKIDCNDQLVLYDGAHAIGKHLAIVSCDKTVSTVGQNGVIFTHTNFVTVRYVTDSWGTDENGFKMIITAFRNSLEYGCHYGFECSRNICIDHDLVCDNVDHCGDGGDERAPAFCKVKLTGRLYSAIMSTGKICPCTERDKSRELAKQSVWQNAALGLPGWMGLDASAITAIIISIVLLTVALVTAYKLYYCRRNTELRSIAARTSAVDEYQLVHGMKGMNGNLHRNTHLNPVDNNGHGGGDGHFRRSAMLQGNGVNGQGGLACDAGPGSAAAAATMMTSLPGNARRPADGRGYKKCWHSLQQPTFKLLHCWLPL